MRNKRTTIRDIANRLSVTPSTVSRALNGNQRISPAMRKAVTQTAAEMNYQPNTVASALRRGKTNIIGVVLPIINRNFFASVVRGIELVAKEAGYSVMLTQNNDDHDQELINLETLMNAQVDGIIISISKGKTDFRNYQRIINRGIPLIFFDRTHEAINASSVVIDDFAGAYAATTHLIEQGCRDIVHLCGDPATSIYQRRREGFLSALKDHNLVFNLERHLIRINQTVEDGKRVGHELLSRTSLPDGIFSASDWGAVGAISVLKSAGVSIPKDIAVVGFANEPFTEYLDPPLSTVDQFSEEIGRSAARAFLQQKEKNHTVTTKVIPPRLIIRKSSLRSL